MAPEAILFDLDETLIDRTASIRRYGECFLKDFHRLLAPTNAAFITETILSADGRGYRPRDDVFAALRNHLTWLQLPAPEQLQSHWFTRFPLTSVARPGLGETLQALTEMGIRMGVVTNGTTQRQRDKIKHLDIAPYLSTVVISEAVAVRKPDPRIFALALSHLHCPASRSWFVGDHPVNDVLGAKAAGLCPIWLSGVHAWPKAHPLPEDQIHALTELVPLAQRANELNM